MPDSGTSGNWRLRKLYLLRQCAVITVSVLFATAALASEEDAPQYSIEDGLVDDSTYMG